MKKKSKHVVLAQGNGNGPFCHKTLRLVKGTTKLNKYDLIAMKSVRSIIWLLLHVFDWLAIITDCEKYFFKVTYLTLLELFSYVWWSNLVMRTVETSKGVFVGIWVIFATLKFLEQTHFWSLLDIINGKLFFFFGTILIHFNWDKNQDATLL